MRKELFRYDHSSKMLIEQPRMQEPLSSNYTVRGANMEILDHDQENYIATLREYKHHLSTLRQFPCNWLSVQDDGKEYEMGVDFKTELQSSEEWQPTYNNPDDPPTETIAIPLSPHSNNKVK